MNRAQQIHDWGNARYFQYYFEAQLGQILKHMDEVDRSNNPALKHRLLQEYAAKAAFNREMIAEYRAQADAADWQQDEGAAKGYVACLEQGAR